MNLSEARKLKDFLNGVAAVAQLLNRAGKEGFFVEFVCLVTSIIDANLRMGLILKHQIENRNNEIPIEYLFQKDSRSYISEKDIYRRSLASGVIDQETYRKLIEYYEDRNKVIHRYIISEITTKQVFKIAFQYEQLETEIREAISRIEKEQIEKGIGMTVAGKDVTDKDLREEVFRMADKKHASEILSHIIRRDNEQ